MKNEYFKIALDNAKKAYSEEEIPVGCVIVRNNEIIASEYNKKEVNKNCLMHAELIAIQAACEKLNNWRLDDCTMYVTLKPCLMCIGAIIESRIKTVYYGTETNSEQMYDVDKIFKYVNLINLNDNESSSLMTDFFKNKRKQ